MSRGPTGIVSGPAQSKLQAQSQGRELCDSSSLGISVETKYIFEGRYLAVSRTPQWVDEKVAHLGLPAFVDFLDGHSGESILEVGRFKPEFSISTLISAQKRMPATLSCQSQLALG